MSDECKIFLVEDSDNDVLLFERELKKIPGVRVAGRVRNGDEAIAYLAGAGQYADRRKYPWPDVVVLDLKMPQRDGFAVLEWMQGKTAMPQVAVFANSEFQLDRERATKLGVVIFQRKTFDPETVQRFVHWLRQLCKLEERRAEEEPDSGKAAS
jgi:CheY-like chemotaxis protein